MAAPEAATTGFTSVNTPAPTPASATPKLEADVEAPIATPSTGTKRKRDSVPKFYAVRVGKAPGIYHTWTECLDQVRGFPKAMFKSFTTASEARNFVDANDGAVGSNGIGAVGKVTKWYGVRSGRVPGVYTTWAEVLDQITGWKGPKHKAFKTRIEAELYIQEVQGGGAADGTADALVESIEHSETTPASKKAKTSKSKKSEVIKNEHASPTSGAGEYEAGDAPLPSDAEDGFDATVALDNLFGALRYKTGSEQTKTKLHAVRPAPSAPIRIYTDGSTLANGQAHAIAGVGVYFGPRHKDNLSEHLPGTKQTNQRAELTAILRALEVAPRDRKIILASDSNYAINCAMVWCFNWRNNGWLNSARKPVENKDLVTKIVTALEERYAMNRHRCPPGEEEDARVDPADEGDKPPGPWEKGPAGVKFVWVKGHAKDEGNNAADELATAGAREAREMVGGDGGEYS
ncbi:hypothetical protein LTR08_005022 [Meristemomyces frigidus]|nr:hypothetical protein LTR08_005022 [Meristemomyces frigidus]